MATTQKALDLCRDLKEEIAFLFPTKTVSDVTIYSDGHPYFTLNDGTPATTEANAVFKVVPAPIVGVDALGTASTAYANHVIQIAIEANRTTGPGHADNLTTQQLLDVIAPCVRKSSVVEIYVRAAGNPPVIGTITGRPSAIYTAPRKSLQNMT